ncbi:unnamed protein product [Urochloa humidicola]
MVLRNLWENLYGSGIRILIPFLLQILCIKLKMGEDFVMLIATGKAQPFCWECAQGDKGLSEEEERNIIEGKGPVV